MDKGVSMWIDFRSPLRCAYSQEFSLILNFGGTLSEDDLAHGTVGWVPNLETGVGVRAAYRLELRGRTPFVLRI
jgi:hypothetical protein